MDKEELRQNDLYCTNTTATWARNNLRVLFDMATDHQLPQWFTEEVKRILDGIETVGTREADRARKATKAHTGVDRRKR